MTITLPYNISFEDWVFDLCDQSPQIPRPLSDWQRWAANLYQCVKNLNYVNPQIYASWNAWAWDFLSANQGDTSARFI